MVHSHASSFNMIGQKTYETDTVLRTDNKTATQTSTYALVDGAGTYLLGAVDHVNGTSALTGSSTRSTLTSNTYAFFDGAVQSAITYDSDTGSGSNPVYTTSFANDAFGQTTPLTTDVE